MTKAFRLESREYLYLKDYKDKEVGLDSPKGTLYGVPIDENSEYIFLKPHIAYNPTPLPNGKTLNNIEKRDFVKKIPKKTLSGLVHEYADGYFDKLVKASGEQDNYSQFQYQHELNSLMSSSGGGIIKAGKLTKI